MVGEKKDLGGPRFDLCITMRGCTGAIHIFRPENPFGVEKSDLGMFSGMLIFWSYLSCQLLRRSQSQSPPNLCRVLFIYTYTLNIP